MCKSSSENKESIYNLVWTRQNKRFNGRLGGKWREKPTNVATRKNKTSDGRVLPAGGAKLLSEEGGHWGELRWSWRPPSRAAPLLRPMIGKASVVQVTRVRAPPGGRHRASRGVTRHVPDTLKPWQFCLSTFITILLTRLAFFHYYFLTIPNEDVQRTGKQNKKKTTNVRFPKKNKIKCPSTDVVTLVTVRNAYFVSAPLVWTASGPAAAGLVACRHFYTRVEWKLAELLRYRLVLKWRRHYWGEHHAALASV